jgi:hypothetical protein
MMIYNALLRDFNKNPNNEDLKALIHLRHLFICALSMKYNPECPEIIEHLTNVKITTDDISALSDNLLKKYKTEEKRIRGIEGSSEKMIFDVI